MDFIRRLLVFIAMSAFTALLFLTVTTTAVSTIINSTNIKSWLKHSDVYYSAVDAILDSTANAAQKNTRDSTDAFSKPEVKNAVKSAFPPSLLQSSTENFIDGTFVWLEGKSEKPTFRIDLRQAKKNLANNLAKYAQDRYKSLPICKTLPPANTNPLDAACRVPSYDITKDIQKFKNDLINNKELFGNPAIITADSIKSGDSKQNFFETSSKLPSAYRLTKIAPYIFGLLSVIASLAIIFLIKDRYKGIQRTSFALIYAAVLLFLMAWLISFGLGKATSATINTGNNANDFAKKTMLSIGKDVGNQVIHINLLFGIIFLVVGGGQLIFAAKKLKNKATPEVKESMPEKPAPDSDKK